MKAVVLFWIGVAAVLLGVLAYGLRISPVVGEPGVAILLAAAYFMAIGLITFRSE